SSPDVSTTCNFGPTEDENIRDRLIAGMLDKELSQKLQIEQDDLSLERAADPAIQYNTIQAKNTSTIGYTVDAAAWGDTS
ncbi:hypothetical protein LSAT2_031408, partial [Lamellibrachia satsuma]